MLASRMRAITWAQPPAPYGRTRTAAFRQHDRQFGRRSVRHLDHPAPMNARIAADEQPSPTVRCGGKRRQFNQPFHAQRQLIATFGSGQGEHLVHHDAGEPAKILRVREDQNCEALRRGQQQMRRRQLPCAAVGGRIAGPGLDRTGSDISATGAIRLRAISVASALSGLTYSVWKPTRRFIKFHQGGQEAGERLAATGRGEQQHTLPGARGVQHCKLVRAGLHPRRANQRKGFR